MDVKSAGTEVKLPDNYRKDMSESNAAHVNRGGERIRHSLGRRSTRKRPNLFRWTKRLDFPEFEGDLEAEKVLQMRMRKKSKRHKDTTTSLFDVIKMKQRELERLQSQSISTTEMDSGHPSHEDEEADDIKGTAGTDRPETESGIDTNSNSNEAQGLDNLSHSVSNYKERQLVDDQGYESKDTESNSNNEEVASKQPRTGADDKRNGNGESKHTPPGTKTSNTVKRQKSNLGSVSDKQSQKKFKEKQGKAIINKNKAKAAEENQSKVNTVKGDDEQKVSHANSKSKISKPKTKSLGNRISNGDIANGHDNPETVKASGKAKTSKPNSKTDKVNKLNMERKSGVGDDDIVNATGKATISKPMSKTEEDNKSEAKMESGDTSHVHSNSESNISKHKENTGKDDKSKVRNVHNDTTQKVTSSNIEAETSKPHAKAKTGQDYKSHNDRKTGNSDQKTDSNSKVNINEPKPSEDDKSNMDIVHGESEQNIVDANSKANVTIPTVEDGLVDESNSNCSESDGTLSHRSHEKQERVIQGSSSNVSEPIVNENAGEKLAKAGNDTEINDHDDWKKTQTDVNSVKQSNEIDTEVQEYVIQDGNTKLVLYKLKTNTSLLESLEKCDNNNQQEKVGDKTASTAESEMRHDISVVSQPETTPSTNMFIDTGKRSPDNLKTNGLINNSNPENNPHDNEASRNVGETLVPHSSDNNGGIRNSNVQSKGTGKTNNKNTGLESSPTREISEKRESAHFTDTEVIRSRIDCEMESNDNKTKSRSVNETGGDRVGDDNGRFKLGTVVNQESISQKHASDTTRKTKTKSEDTRMDKNRSIPQTKGTRDRSGSDSGNGIISQEPEEKQRTKENIQPDGGGKSLIPKRPKRSLGNGFLVSADDGDDKDDVTQDKMDIARDTKSGDKVEGADIATVSAHDKETRSFGSKAEMGAANHQPTTSGRQSKTSSGSKQLLSAAKQAFVASKIKQTFDEANDQQNNYVQELGNTRKELWEILRKMKAGEDEDESDETEELEEEELEVPEETASEDDDDGEDDILTQEEVLTTNSTTRPKTFVATRIDSRWDPNHPLYKQIQEGFPSTFKRLEARNVHAALKSLHVDKFDTKQVSSNNVYVIEARRIYPKAFPDSETSEHTVRKAVTQPTDSLNSDTTKRYHPDKLERQITLYGKKCIQRTEEHKQIADYKPRNVKRVKRSNTGKGVVEKQDTSTPKKAIAPRFKPNLRPNQFDTEEGKLKKEKDKVKYYQDYLDNTETIQPPKTRHKKNKVAPQINRNPTKRDTIVVHTAKFNSQQHANGVDDDHDDDDDNDVTLDDTDPEPTITRETANEKLVRLSSARSVGSNRRTENVPISKAVEIVQSRHKFYDNNRYEIQTNQRDNRIFKLYREIQMIRRKGDNADAPEAGMNTSGFLMMDYEFSRTTLSSQKTDNELQRFLRNSLDYEVCVRSRSLRSYPRRRDKALIELKQKLDHPLVYSSNIR